jgi:hypothetical protein
MRRTGPNRTAMTAIVTVLALLGWLSGPLWAGCCPSETTAPATSMTGCHGESAPKIQPPCCGGKEAGNCCGRIQAVAPATATPTPAPAPLCAQLSPLSSAEPVQQDAAPVRLPPLPPPLHADVGLYTLHAVFLI